MKKKDQKIKLGSNRFVGKKFIPYFIAELNTSHFGNIDVAKKMIESAKQMGCDCIKLQSWTSNSINSDEYYKKNPITKKFFDRYSLNENALKKLSLFCKKLNIDFSSTPYSTDEVDFLVDECNASFIKIASMDLNNLEFLEYIGKKNKAVILSTGMGSLEEIREAVKTLKKTGNKNLAILHCVSIYPTPHKLANLNNIRGLIDEFPNIPIGFSDHTIGPEAAAAAIALGASIIEKHFTLDKSKIGMDNQMSSEPNEIKQMITYSKNVYLSLGKTKRIVSKEELKQRLIMRRSLIAKKNLKKKQKIKKEDLILKRPGTGIPVNNLKKIIGKKINKNLKAETIIKYKDISR